MIGFGMVVLVGRRSWKAFRYGLAGMLLLLVRTELVSLR